MPIYPSNKSTTVAKKKRHQSRLGISLVCIFSCLLVELIFNLIPFFNAFIYGVIGLSVYPISLFFIAFGVMKIKRVEIKITSKELTYLVICFLCLLAMAHIFTSNEIINNTFKFYLLETYECSSCYTAGGVIFSFLVYPVYSLTHMAGASVFFAIVLLLFLCLFVDSMYKRKQTQVLLEDSTSNMIRTEVSKDTPSEEVRQEPQHKALFDEDLFIDDTEESVKDENVDKSIALKILGLNKEPELEIDDDDEDLFEDDTEEEFSKKPQMVLHEDEQLFESQESVSMYDKVLVSSNNNNFKQQQENIEKEERKKRNKAYLDDIMGISSNSRENTQKPQSKEIRSSAKEKLFGTSTNIFANSNSQSTQSSERRIYDTQTNYVQPKKENIIEGQPNIDIYDEDLTLKSYEKNKVEYIDKLNQFDTASAKIARAKEVYNLNESTNRVQSQSYTSNVVNVNEINKIKSSSDKLKVKRKPYVKPPLDLLETYINNNVEVENNAIKAQRLEQTLDSFRIPAKVCSVARGPSFTRFELTMPVGISVKKIDNLVPDMQMALACKGAIRTEIPIPGKNAFGIEIPNEQKETVGLKDIIESYEFQNSKYSTAYGLGKDISNSAIIGNIEKMPHLLVAGTTGSGKSVCLNSMLVSLLYKSGPEDLRLILIDPKRLEFSLYNGLPHLLIPNVITDKEKAMNAFDWLIDEMNRRINYFDSLKAGIRNLEEYNSSPKVKSGEWEKLPRIVAVVDELNELMMQTKKEMESKIVRIAQLSRAVGIHLVLATQRPSTDVITGLIKSNLPSRIAFAVPSFSDSVTILNQGGAESLLGYGDMLYSPVGTNKPHRIQGAFLKNSEVEKVVNFIKDNNDCIFDEEVEDQMFNRNTDVSVAESTSNGGGSGSNNLDPLMKDVLRFAIQSGGISTTRVQRFLRIGYPRAAKIIDDMEALNYISKKDEKNNRVIFMTQQEFEEVFGEDF